MRYPTLVPTFRAIARAFADDSVADEIALAVDHQLHRNADQLGDHALAWGAMLTAQLTLERIEAGAPTPLGPERVAELAALPGAILTVVALRDGAGFSLDAIAIAVHRPASEVQWLSDQCPAAPLPLPEPVPEAAPDPAPPSMPSAIDAPPPSAQPIDLRTPSQPPTPAAADSAPLSTGRRAVVAALVVVALIAGLLAVASIMGGRKDGASDDTDPDGAVGAGISVTKSPTSPACADIPPPDPFPPAELEVPTDGTASSAMLAAATPSDTPRPLIVVLAPAGASGFAALAGTQFEQDAATRGAALAVLDSHEEAGWSIPVDGARTSDLDALGELIQRAGTRACIDNTRITLIGLDDSAVFAAAAVCAAPTIATHLVLIRDVQIPETCTPSPAGGMLTLIDASAEDSSDDLARIADVRAQLTCGVPNDTTSEAFALSAALDCAEGRQIWAATVPGLASWTGVVDDVIRVFLEETGATT